MGQKYPAGVYQSKRYQRELERYGGKANVIFDELDRWLASLWQGKKLGITLGWISVDRIACPVSTCALPVPQT